MVVGLTGGIGSGKTTILNMFKEFNIAVYIADIEAKKQMNTSLKIREKLIKEFGRKTYQNNQLNRTYLAKIVFNNKKKLQLLNNIVHPEVNKHLHTFIKNNANKKYIIYENAILFENGNETLCDKIITVIAPQKVKIKRVMERDNISKKEVVQRINNQWLEEKKRMQCNYLIENIELKNTKKTVKDIHNFLTQKK